MAGLRLSSAGGPPESRAGRESSSKPDYYRLPSLFAESQKLGFEFRYYSTVPSTMPIVDDLAFAGVEGPAVVIADHQTEGVGRKDRVWRDNSGCSILMSVLLKLKREDVMHAGLLADLAALRVAMSLSESAGEDFKIKYPNDIVYDGAKLGGILVKNLFFGNEYVGTNVGIGINVHYSDEELKAFKPDYPATSVDSVNGRENSRQNLVQNMLAALRYAVADTVGIAYNNADQERFNNLWREKSAVLERNISVLSGDKPVARGKVIDTKMGEGILLESSEGTRWYNLFDTSMKVEVDDGRE